MLVTNKKLLAHLKKQEDTPYLDAMKRLFRYQSSLYPDNKVRNVYMAGGAAVHFFIRSRFTDDVDAEFIGRPLSYGHTESYVHPERGMKKLYFDPKYNSSLSLLNENYQDDAVDVSYFFDGIDNLKIHIFSPVHIAISKIARFSDKDKMDIFQLSQLGLIDPKQFNDMAMDALSYGIGNVSMMRFNVEESTKVIEDNVAKLKVETLSKRTVVKP